MKVSDLIARDEWAGVSIKKAAGPGILRWRRPVLSPGVDNSHPVLLQVLWAYDDVGSGTMPKSEVLDAMEVFEIRLCAAWETNALAVLTAVLTFDGARQWVFYTDDVESCAKRLNEMPQEAERYPIELTYRPDPAWEFLREGVLRDVEK